MPRRSVVGLILCAAVLLGQTASTNPPMPPGFLSAYHWESDDPLFGGFSAIALTGEGRDFVALSDRGNFTAGWVLRGQDGKIAGLAAAPIRPLKGPDNLPLGDYRRDSEGLAILPDGRVFVSFELIARVAFFPTLDSLGTVLPKSEAFRSMQRNASLEALAVDPAGTLYTLPERSGSPSAPFPVYRYKDGVWDQPFTLPRRGMFLAVAADIGPDGKFYLLEREFHGLAGFASRVRRFTIGPDALTDEETLLQSATGQHDNLEGLSVWRDQAGQLRLTMISDDNMLFLQRTEIVEYRVPG